MMSDQIELGSVRGTSGLVCGICAGERVSDWFTSDEEVQAVQQEKAITPHDIKDLLYDFGQPCEGLYCVLSGTVVLERFSLGRRRLHLVQAGDMLGWADFFGGGLHRSRATCLTEAIICAVPGPLVRRLVGRDHLLAFRFLGQAVQDVKELEREGYSDSQTVARDRLASALRELVQQSGNGTTGGRSGITLPLSRRDVADLIGVAPESLSSAIRDLEESGTAHFSGRHVKVANPARLSQAVAGKGIVAA